MKEGPREFESCSTLSDLPGGELSLLAGAVGGSLF
jgi:hypothetical protein